jgi:hypothetical protein
LPQLLADERLKLQVTSFTNNLVDVERTPVKLSRVLDIVLTYGLKEQRKEGLVIHSVRLIDIRVESEDNTIGQNRNTTVRRCEVAKQLGGVIDRQIDVCQLALDKHLHLAVFADSIIDLLVLLRSHVAGESRDNLT